MKKYFECEIDDYEEEYSEEDMVLRVSQVEDIEEEEDLYELFNENNEGATICGQYYSASEIYRAVCGDTALDDELYEIATNMASDREHDARYELRRMNNVGDEATIGNSWIVRLVRIEEDEIRTPLPETKSDMEEEFSRLLISA